MTFDGCPQCGYPSMSRLDDESLRCPECGMTLPIGSIVVPVPTARNHAAPVNRALLVVFCLSIILMAIGATAAVALAGRIAAIGVIALAVVFRIVEETRMPVPDDAARRSAAVASSDAVEIWGGGQLQYRLSRIGANGDRHQIAVERRALGGSAIVLRDRRTGARRGSVVVALRGAEFDRVAARIAAFGGPAIED